MEREHEIQEELRALNSPLAGFSRAMPFKVPKDFFESLGGRIAAGVIAAETVEDETPALTRALPFTVPDGYFEKSAEQILTAATLPAPDTQGFEVPAGYFDALPGRVMAAIQKERQPSQKQRTIAFQPARRALRWAMAAMLVLGIGIGSYRIYYTPDRKALNQLASVDGSTITDYVDQNVVAAPDAVAINTPATAQVQALSKEDIAAYLDETGWEDGPTAD